MRAWRASGVSAAKYSEEHGLSKGSLCRWAAEVDGRGSRVRPAPEPRTAFMRLEVAPKVRVEPGFDAGLLREVVRETCSVLFVYLRRRASDSSFPRVT